MGLECCSTALHSLCAGAAVAGAITAGCINYFREQTEAGTDGDSTDDSHELVNWSNTHQCKPKVFHEPETTEQIKAVVAKAHAAGRPQAHMTPPVSRHNDYRGCPRCCKQPGT